jgi:hypothetical protein
MLTFERMTGESLMEPLVRALYAACGYDCNVGIGEVRVGILGYDLELLRKFTES